MKLLAGHNLPQIGGVLVGHGLSGGAPSVSALSIEPTARWHPAFSATTESGGRVVSASDLQGLADVSEGGAGIGPQVLTDANGDKFWRFLGVEYLDVATTLVTNSRELTVFFVGRVLAGARTRFFAAGNLNAGTQANTLGGLITIAPETGQSFVGVVNKFGYNVTSGAESLVVGAQKQIVGAACGPTDTRLGINNQAAMAGSAVFNTTGRLGAEIGRDPWTPGASGSWAEMDLYELVVYDRVLTNAEYDAIAAELMASHNIVAVDSQLVIEGDSILAGGFADVTPDKRASTVLSAPGAGYVPSNFRVVAVPASGDKVADLVADRDTPQTIFEYKLAGENIVAFQIGANDLSAGTGQSIYDEIVALINTPTTGYVQRGWRVRQMVNIAGANSQNFPKLEDLRALLLDPQFLTDTLTGAAQAYEGQLEIIRTDLIEHNGETRFFERLDGTNAAYYHTDGLHPNANGTEKMVTGGDTPQYGVGYGLT